MAENAQALSILHLDRILFDRIEFKRLGFPTDKEFEVSIRSGVSQKQGMDVYRVTLELEGNKPEEYHMEICLTGYFSFSSGGELTEEMKNTLISKNTVAILMPYLRSQVSLLTAQPGVECVVLPAFNINNMLEEE